MKTILLIDDDSKMLKLLKSYLDPVYTVYPMKGGSAALGFLQDNKPDLIILDYMMPGVDGPHTLELIRDINGCENIPAMFLTGVTEKARMMECLSKNPAGYLVKPVAREELLLKVAEIFADKK